MNIVLYPNPILEKVAEPIENISDYKSILLEMKSYVEDPESKAAGIALPQVGISKRGFIAFIEDKVEIFINPRIIKASKGAISLTGGEGCLSIPGVNGVVPRHKKIEIVYTNIEGERIAKTLSDLDSVVFQHEFDHLNGVLFITKMRKEQEEQTA